MKTLTRSLACLVLGAATVVAAGCAGKDEPTKPTMKPAATMPTTMASKAPAPAPAVPAGPALKAEDMTHTVAMDTPIFGTKASASGGKPEGLLKKGEKVLVMAPGKLAQVTTMAGATGYVATASLTPIGK
jgi:hypothetical protein